MAEETGISWADSTFNPWIGCTKVSPSCDFCYAEKYDNRFGGGHWGPRAPRRHTSAPNWRKPYGWARTLPALLGRRPRVFGGSLCDVFDKEVPTEWRADYWHLIRNTPELDWLLLTKRPQLVRRMVPRDWPLKNVWLGTTVENRKEARRLKHLVEAGAVVNFVSAEPLFEDISTEIARYLTTDEEHGVDWVICGGENAGPNTRDMPERAPYALRDVCQQHRTAFYMKQMARLAPIPEALLIREFPRAA